MGFLAQSQPPLRRLQEGGWELPGPDVVNSEVARRPVPFGGSQAGGWYQNLTRASRNLRLPEAPIERRVTWGQPHGPRWDARSTLVRADNKEATSV